MRAQYLERSGPMRAQYHERSGPMRDLHTKSSLCQVWSSELEAVAQRWADQCSFGHDSERAKLDGTYVGQNTYWGGTSMEQGRVPHCSQGEGGCQQSRASKDPN